MTNSVASLVPIYIIPSSNKGLWSSDHLFDEDIGMNFETITQLGVQQAEISTVVQ